MFRPGFTILPAAALIATLGAAQAATPAVPPGLLGAWGDDSGCAANVAIFRADGTVSLPQSGPDMPVTTFAVQGPNIIFTQGKHTGSFAFALDDVAVAWSNGTHVVLKARCADQSSFASNASQKRGLPASTAETQASLFGQIKTLAAAPLVYNGVTIKVESVSAVAGSAVAASGPIYSAVTAKPDAAAVGKGAELFYRVFPTEAAAAAYVSPDRTKAGNFIHEERQPGSFATASATDTGPSGKAAPVTVNCLRLHPAHTNAVRISCFAHLPGSPLVAGGAQTFPLDKSAHANDLGPKDDLSETLDLTSLAITQLRGFHGGQHG